MSMSNKQWWGQIANTIISSGRHIPVAWTLEYDNGDDGCMPSGWYVIGRDSNMCAITWPIRHEYGEFLSLKEAREFAEQANKTLGTEIPINIGE